MLKLDINLKLSLFFCWTIIVVVALSLLIIIALPLSGWVRGVLLITTFCYGSFIFYFIALFGQKEAIIGLHFSDSKWQVRQHRGESPAILSGDSTVTTVLCV